MNCEKSFLSIPHLTGICFLLLSLLTVNQAFTQATGQAALEPTQCEAPLKLIRVPEGFEESQAFNGYIHLQTATSIVMTEVKNVNYLRLCSGMTPDYFNSNGLNFVSEGEFVSQHKVSGKFYKSKFILNELPHIRYMVFSGDLNHTLWLSITYPEMFEPVIEKELQGIFQSIKTTVEDEK